ncbi:MAG: hypothetical protein LUQ38_06390 [Methanotrichaceae archaeon]|nr:hypothetical protein [Methanotrichaceae archaeon]
MKSKRSVPCTRGSFNPQGAESSTTVLPSCYRSWRTQNAIAWRTGQWTSWFPATPKISPSVTVFSAPGTPWRG